MRSSGIIFTSLLACLWLVVACYGRLLSLLCVLKTVLMFLLFIPVVALVIAFDASVGDFSN